MAKKLASKKKPLQKLYRRLRKHSKQKLYIHYPNFHKDVKVGNKIMIDDGKLGSDCKKNIT
ncbi:pyruvate kinase [Niabella ginsengisoli]|uniref:Pyruvate kinase n=1 Tax=Niabella ginsengisoli TaxID=522298 RepID=A0ABS9SM88_9BACT|nr:pyruvate kinase [Niabella ginsengisoli]MCH5599477.1 pyruvate kinase [Niabella ginsengisoli]